MKYVPGPLVGQLSKSQGNTTASHNRNGSYLRNRVIPVNPNTPSQQVFRNDQAELAGEWRKLSAANRLGWQALGLSIHKQDSLGQDYTLTGEQAYISVNRLRRWIGLADLSVAPPIATASLLTSLVVTGEVTPASLSVAFTPTPLQATERVIIEATRAVSAGITSLPRSEYKGLVISGLAGTSPIDILAAWQGKYGPIAAAEGLKIFVRARVTANENFVGVPLHDDVVVIP